MTQQNTVGVRIPTLNRYLGWIEGLRASNSFDLGFEDHPRVGHAGPVEYDPAFAVRGGPLVVWG